MSDARAPDFGSLLDEPLLQGDGPELDALALIDRLQRRGAARMDPVRFHFIQALANRNLEQTGPVRRTVNERLHGLLSEYAERFALWTAGKNADAQAPALGDDPPLSPLAGLIDRLRQRDLRFEPASPAGQDSQMAGAASSELEARELARQRDIAYFRRTWSRLSAEQRLAQSESTLPENAGPLNSRQLVHRALSRMQELSNEYLVQFVSHVDALLWLESALTPDSRPAAAARSEPDKRRGGRRK